MWNQRKNLQITWKGQAIDRFMNVYLCKYLNLLKKMESFPISQKENKHFMVLPIITTHGSLVINHQQKKKKTDFTLTDITQDSRRSINY